MKNGTFASPATARAVSVLPVPGGPTSNTPRGIRPPSRWNFWGSRRNSTNFLKVFLGLVDAGNVIESGRAIAPRSGALAFDLPESHGTPPPRPASVATGRSRPAMKIRIGSQFRKSATNQGVLVLRAAPLRRLKNCTPRFPAGSCTRLGSFLGAKVRKAAPSWYAPGDLVHRRSRHSDATRPPRR